MRPASPQFLASLRYSHIAAARVELIFPGAADADAVSVPVEAGSVTIDRTAQNRRSGSLRIPWSLRAGFDLGVDVRDLPLGGYALVYRGLRYADGSTELMLLGRLRVESVTWGTLDASASLELADRNAQVRDEPFAAPLPALGKTPHGAAVDIIRGVFGATIAYHTPYQPAGTLGDITWTGARTDALSQLEQSYGAETYFDANGDFVFAAKPADDEPVVWTVDAGELGVMVDARESLDRTGVYNGVYVKGQAQADLPPVSALATFDDATSPIRWGGPFGKVTLLADSTTATTTQEAQTAADNLLRLRLKQTRSLELTAAPNPALEAGDTITVVFPDGRTERHLIDATTISLSTDAQQVVTRTQVTPGAQAVQGVPPVDMARAQAEETWVTA
ncbi:MAG TPA: DUF5047 domain-containing protein [Gaiellales bacterium]|nr:DUF5047 domain-containing protein [Gaiellales bacterium]